MANDRKRGRRKTDLSDESSVKVLKVAKSLVRTDFGGSKDPLGVIQKKMADRGIEAGPKSCQAIKELLEDMVDGTRKRLFPRIDEVIHRLEAGPAPESMP
jgi:hypothetical protein